MEYTEEDYILAGKLLLDGPNTSFHEMSINLNDTFYYASADSETIYEYDIAKILPTFKKYGQDTLVAYAAIVRGHDPQIKQNITENYKEAKKELGALLDDDIFMMDHKDRDDKLYNMMDRLFVQAARVLEKHNLLGELTDWTQTWYGWLKDEQKEKK